MEMLKDKTDYSIGRPLVKEILSLSQILVLLVESAYYERPFTLKVKKKYNLIDRFHSCVVSHS